MRLRLAIILALLLLLCFPFVAIATTADSCSIADVQTAYDATSAGGTLTIPACNDGATWTSGLTVNKAITIAGNGSTGSSRSHIIAGANISTGIFNITASTTDVVKISGIYIDLNTRSTPAFYFNGTMTQLVIMNNYINAGASYHCYKAGGGKAYGVISGNTFRNSLITFDITGPNSTSWGEDINAGALNTNTLYIEGNTFLRDNSLTCASNLQNHLESSQGAKYVARYNTFDGTAFCGGASVEIDYHVMPHGNGSSWPSERGSPIIEYYNNYSSSSRNYHWVMRGGSIVAHDNIIKGGVGFGLREETCESGGCTWPSTDQIYNSFFWNNYQDDAKTTPVEVFYWGGQEGIITENRDYFLHAPVSSGGKETLYDDTTTKWTRYDVTHKMTFSSEGTNAYYPYTPYTCPHPLTGLTGTCDATMYGTTGYNIAGGSSVTSISGCTLSGGSIK